MNKKLYRSVLRLAGVYFLSLFIFKPALGISDNNKWQLVKDEAGIQVFILETDNSDIVKAKSSIVVNASLSSVQSLLDNIETRHEWIPYLVKSQLIKYESDNETLEYSVFSAPWPASDRDFVYRLRQISSSKNKKIYTMNSEVSDLMPISSSAIRAVLFESVYTLTLLDEQKTKIELTFHADLKGWIPVWVANVVQKSLPYKTLKNLQHELNKQNNKTVRF